MNWSELRFAALVGFLLAAGAQAIDESASYTFVVSENGAVLALASFPQAVANESKRVELELPGDASEPVVSGALYAVVNNSLLLSRSSNTTALVAFTSSQLTSKRGAAWGLNASLSPSFAQADVRVLLPPKAMLSFFSPARMLVSPRNDSLELQWNATPAKTVFLEYRFELPTVPAPVVSPTVVPTPPPKAEPGGFAAFVLFAALVLLIAYALYKRMQRTPPKTAPPQPLEQQALFTQGQRNVLRALSENDVKVVEAIAQAGGEFKRFQLEKRLEIAKSSLALSLRRLEQKNILAIDRALVFQRVRLSEWFKAL